MFIGQRSDDAAYYGTELKKALEDCKRAENILDNAVDADMIDYAILDLEVSRKKYDVLLKRYKESCL